MILRTHMTTVLFSMLCLALLASCNIVGPVALLLEGPPKKEAATELNEARTHVFFIDDRASLLPKRSLRGVIGSSAEQTLINRKVLAAEKVVPSARAMRVVEYESSGAPMSIADIGRQVGAEIVVYMTIDAWSLTRDGSSPAPTARARVKIIDATNNERIFPAQDTGYPVMVRSPTGTGTLPSERAAIAALERELAIALGTELAKVFFEHEIDPMTNRRL